MATVRRRHHLQRWHSPSRQGSIALHVVGLLSFSACYRHLMVWPSPANEAYGWHWQYLTILGLTVSTMSFVCGLLADLTLSHTLFTAKNILSLCSAPLELLISILYWGLSAVDRSLVVPPDFELHFLADIGFHAMPTILLTADLMLFSPPWTIQTVNAMGLSTTIAFAYWGWVEHCFQYNGWYPYPLFAQLSTPQRVVLFAVSAVLMTACTHLLKTLYGQINGFDEGPKKTTPANIKGE